MFRRVLAIALVACAIGLAFWAYARRPERAIAASRTPAIAHAPPTQPAMRLQPRPVERLAPAQWTPAQVAGLDVDLRRAFAPALQGADRWSLVVLDAGGGVVFADRPSQAVTPASTTKLIVAAAALDALGPAYRYHTIFSAAAPIGADGSLDGKLWLEGSGDPSLSSAEIRGGVGTLKRAGLRAIGGLALDPSAMSGPAINPHWDPNDRGQDYAAPTSALSIDGNTYQTTATVGGVQQRFWTPVDDATRYATSLVSGMLRGAGVAAASAPVVASAPVDTVVLWDHPSQPLRALEAHMLAESDNHYAEQLLRTLGAHTSGTGDDSAGLRAESEFLQRLGIATQGSVLQDGSGLSPGDRLSALEEARVLLRADPTLYGLLPLGGREGTLTDYPFTDALGRVRAKSGHITGVAALSGYVNSRRHGRLMFAFLINGSPGDPDTAIVRAVDRLSNG